MPQIRDDICALVGETPIFRLPRLSEAAGAEILAKAEHLNPGGSIKDRVALEMVLDAERSGRLEPGMTLVEATAGNTGLGLAWIAAARGYRFVAIMSEADLGPKTEAMEAIGTECVLVKKGVAWDSDEGPVGLGSKIAAERGGLFLNQFANPANPRAHERTGEEIRDALGDSLDAVVLGVGTGGTATGIGRILRRDLPEVRLIGVAADGSYLGSEREGDRIAGITPDFAPQIFEPEMLHEIVAIRSEDAHAATRRLARTEGVAGGHSSGALLLAAEAEAQRRPGSMILIVICDGVRNYPSLCRL